MWLAVAELTTVPSPKLMLVLAIEPPEFGSLDPAVEALTDNGAVPEVGLTESCATGGWAGGGAATAAEAVTVAVVVPVSPFVSVTVAVTVYVPAEL